MHPVRTAKRAVTPRPVRQVSRAVYTITNPLGAAENKLINAAFGSGSHNRRRSNSTNSQGTRRTAPSQAARGTTTATGAGSRVAEATAFHLELAELMAVQKERFTPAQRPILAPPVPVDPAPFEQQEWTRLKSGTHFWQRARRKKLQLQAAHHAQRHAAELTTRTQDHHRALQTQADAWWTSLQQGQPEALRAVLDAAFADNPAPVTVERAEAHIAALTVLLPGPDVLPTKKAHVTPTGRLSSKAWTKTEYNEVYADLLGAHLLATIRETWATAPSLTHLRITGLRHAPQGPDDLLFVVEVGRQDKPWHHNDSGTEVLHSAPHGLNRVGKTREVRTWPTTACS